VISVVKVKVKPMKKIVRNYVLSTAKAMMNYRDHLVEKEAQVLLFKENRISEQQHAVPYA